MINFSLIRNETDLYDVTNYVLSWNVFWIIQLSLALFWILEYSVDNKNIKLSFKKVLSLVELLESNQLLSNYVQQYEGIRNTYKNIIKLLKLLVIFIIKYIWV